MKRIIYEVPRWSVFLHRLARGLESAHEGDGPGRKLEDELFERVYDGGVQDLPERERDRRLAPWAIKVHEACAALPAFERLACECRGDTDAAAVAVERLVEDLRESSSAATPPEIRGLVRAAAGAASAAVDEFREASAGLEHIGFGEGTNGSRTGLARRLRDDPRLRRVAMLAGRFRRIAAQKRRQRHRHGADEISDIELGANLERVLPSELARLRHPKLRLAFLRDLVEGRCPQYQLTGTETLGRGALVVAVDKSSSMEGAPDEWATAVALALLGIAQQESRPFGLVIFNGNVLSSQIVRPGEALPEAALVAPCSGGTDISNAVSASLDIVQTNGVIRSADIVLITDGASDTTLAAELRARVRELDVTVLGVGIGVEKQALEPWCDAIEVVSTTETLTEPAAEALFGG